ncbi:MAG: SDR family oxidoreductase [Oligoflexia bacterium]|nr:SDR family oxidoreductase [Oligoflexia bacterium]
MIKDWFGLDHVTCVIAGSEGLIGKSCVKALTDCGANVIGIDIQKRTQLVRKNFQYTNLNIANKFPATQLSSIIKKNPQANKAKELFFINCTYPRTKNWAHLDFKSITEQDWCNNLNLHLKSAFFYSKFAVDFLMQQNKSGGIINFSSIYSLHGPDLNIYSGTQMINPVPYSTIKAGIVGFSKYISTVYGQNNIRSNIISPGGVIDKQSKKFIRAYEKKTPMKRMAKVEEISGVCAFLASPAAKYINGQIIYVDGGWTAW